MKNIDLENLENIDILNNIDLTTKNLNSNNNSKINLESCIMDEINTDNKSWFNLESYILDELNTNDNSKLNLESYILDELNTDDNSKLNLEKNKNNDHSLDWEINQINIDDIINSNKIETLVNNEILIQEEIIKETLKKVTKKEDIKNKKSIIFWIIFISKYILTSGLIFWILLISTNYSAYTSIAKSYIFKWELENKQQRLMSSVDASSIKEKYIEDKIKKVNLEENIQDTELSIKRMKKEQDKESINLNIEITPYENRVIIPKIWKNIPLIEIKNAKIEWQKELNDIFMKELENGIIRYPGSSKPWEDGNSFIFWHSSNFPWMKWDYNDVFALLDKVVFDDEVIVYYWQEKYVYKIKEKKVITPGDVSILERNKNKSEITLMTCWPIWTTLNRLIVVWELIEKK